MGRTGKLYAVEHWGVEPDILCIAKGIASGMPLGAMVARDEVMDWPSGSHASTFGGNPVSCRAALATLDLLQSEYTANAVARGEQLHAGLLHLRERHPIVGEVRGLGLMQAVDIVKDAAGRVPDPALRDEVIQLAFHRGLLLLGCGECGVRFCPPLCITAEQVETALHILDGVLTGFRPAAVAV
jgi:4-aminobutyrate aminotransferase